MLRKLLCSFAALVVLALVTSSALATTIPIVVYPNPVQFGSVPEFQTGSTWIYITNTAATTVYVTGMAINGTNSTDFNFSGPTCTGGISAGQTCQMQLLFAPTSVGSLTANLQITVQGSSQSLNIPLIGTGGSPAPTLTSISPTSTYQNSGSLTLTANGTGFSSGATVYFAYSAPLVTTFVSSTQLTAVVPASFFINTNNYSVWVVNPDNQQTSSLEFSVVGRTPIINSLSPSSAVAGSTPSPITIAGQNFMNGAKILLNGSPVSTTYIDNGNLQFTPTKAQLGAARIAQVSVSNPPPGGISGSTNFNVTYPAKVATLNLPANDLVWDPYAQRIYASLPSSYGSNGNSIAVINPATGKVLGYHFAGSEPGHLALSADSKYLYVGLNGNNSVQRLILPNFTPDIDVPLTGNGYGGLPVALSLAVDPADSHTFAVAEGPTGCCGNYGLFFYKDATLLPNSITYPSFSYILFASASTMYGYSSGTVGQITVDANGGTLGTQWNGLVNGTSIQYTGGLIYGNGGQVLNPSTGMLVGTYDLGCCNAVDQLLADPAVNHTFAAGTTPFFNQLGITTFDLKRFTPIAIADLSQFSGSILPPFSRWGSTGFAFLAEPQYCCGTPLQTVLVQSPAMFATAGSNPVPAAQSLSPASTNHGRGNLLVAIKGSNFVPNSQVSFNGTPLFADYVSSTQLNLYVPGGALGTAGTANVVVSNPTPGGGTSTPLTFTIN